MLHPAHRHGIPLCTECGHRQDWSRIKHFNECSLAPPQHERKAMVLAIYEQAGVVVPDCIGCAPFYDSPEGTAHAPSHRGSRRCKSGSLASGGTHAHCTCDTCF